MTSSARGAMLLVGAALALAGGTRAFAQGATHGAAPVPAGAGVELVAWDQQGNFAALLSRARTAQKLVFLDFFATWCGPCKLMDRTVYTDSSAARAANRLVARKVDAEKGEGIALAARYGIHYYPTLVVVDATGKERARQVGYVPADRFVRFLDDARTGRGTAAEIEAKIARGEDTMDNRIALAAKATETRDFATAREQVTRLAARDTTAAGVQASGPWLALLRAEAQADDPAATLADARAFLARYPAHANRFEVMEIMAYAHAARAEKDSAVAVYRAIAGAQPGNAGALAAFARFCAAQGAALDEALAAARQAVELSRGKDAGALDALADVYAARGQFDQAVDTAQQALDLNPADDNRRGRLETFQEQAVQALHAKSTGGAR